jgi:hypothetical protein
MIRIDTEQRKKTCIYRDDERLFSKRSIAFIFGVFVYIAIKE